MLEDPRTEHALRALRETNLGEFAGAASTLGSYKEVRRHRKTLETMEVEPKDFEGWSEAEEYFHAIEALAGQLDSPGLQRVPVFRTFIRPNRRSWR